MPSFVEVNRLKRHSRQVFIDRRFVPYGTLVRQMQPGDKLFAVLVYHASSEEFADIRLIREERDYDWAVSMAKKATKIRHLEWLIQSPEQRLGMLQAELNSLNASVAAEPDLDIVSRRAELQREIKRLDRHLAGKHPLPWWNYKRWLKPRG